MKVSGTAEGAYGPVRRCPGATTLLSRGPGRATRSASRRDGQAGEIVDGERA